MSESEPPELLPSEYARLAEVGRFGTERIPALATTLRVAFADDPYLNWIYGDLDTEGQQEFWTLALQGQPAGSEMHAHQTSESVAVWQPMHLGIEGTNVVDPDADARNQRFQQLFGDRAEEVFTVLGGMHSHHPEGPHWYLQACGTQPTRQNEGLGSQVLAPMLSRCDDLGILAYLESTNPKNHSFYFRQGFEEIGRYQAETAPEIVLMQRIAARG